MKELYYKYDSLLRENGIESFYILTSILILWVISDIKKYSRNWKEVSAMNKANIISRAFASLVMLLSSIMIFLKERGFFN